MRDTQHVKFARLMQLLILYVRAESSQTLERLFKLANTGPLIRIILG